MDPGTFAGKTLPPGFEDPGSDSESDEVPICGKRPCVEMLQDEVQRLRCEINRLEGSKRRKKNFKPGATQVLYLMNALQRFYNTQERQQALRKEGSPGYDVRLMLTELLDAWMTELDDKAKEKGFDWRKVPNRPHARPVAFNVNE